MNILDVFCILFSETFSPVYVKISVVSVVNIVYSYCGTVKTYIILLRFVGSIGTPYIKLVSEERPMPTNVRTNLKSRFCRERYSLFFPIFIFSVYGIEIKQINCLSHSGEIVMIRFYISCIYSVEVLKKTV